MMKKEGGTGMMSRVLVWQTRRTEVPFTKTGIKTGIRLVVLVFVFDGEKDVNGSNLNMLNLNFLWKFK